MNKRTFSPSQDSDDSSIEPQYYYYSKDHLGNIRSVVAKNPTDNSIQEVQRTHYYPFGGIIADISTGRDVQNRLYNGKELDTDHGLNWYDYGARNYDPVRGQFINPDPLAEKFYGWGMYGYCLNNPVKYIDPDGRKIVLAKGSSVDFQKQYELARQYLLRNNCSEVLTTLEDMSETITILEHQGKSNSFDKGIITWNPRSGIYTSADSEGHRLSPSIRLLHEMGHALQSLIDPEYNKNTQGDGSLWNCKEEKRNILEVETPAATACGEINIGSISRDSHSGIAFDTNNSTSTNILNPEDPDVKMMIDCWE